MVQGPLRNPITEQDRIAKHEGFRPDVYRDTMGRMTVGYGHLLSPEEQKQYKVGDTWKGDLRGLFNKDYESHRKSAEKIAKDYNITNPEAVNVLTNMTYQMGEKGVRGFENTLNLLQQGDYQGASREMLNSDWAKQTSGRARDLSGRIAGLGSNGGNMATFQEGRENYLRNQSDAFQKRLAEEKIRSRQILEQKSSRAQDKYFNSYDYFRQGRPDLPEGTARQMWELSQQNEGPFLGGGDPSVRPGVRGPLRDPYGDGAGKLPVTRREPATNKYKFSDTYDQFVRGNPTIRSEEGQGFRESSNPLAGYKQKDLGINNPLSGYKQASLQGGSRAGVDGYTGADPKRDGRTWWERTTDWIDAERAKPLSEQMETFGLDSWESPAEYQARMNANKIGRIANIDDARKAAQSTSGMAALTSGRFDTPQAKPNNVNKSGVDTVYSSAKGLTSENGAGDPTTPGAPPSSDRPSVPPMPITPQQPVPKAPGSALGPVMPAPQTDATGAHVEAPVDEAKKIFSENSTAIREAQVAAAAIAADDNIPASQKSSVFEQYVEQQNIDNLSFYKGLMNFGTTLLGGGTIGQAIAGGFQGYLGSEEQIKRQKRADSMIDEARANGYEVSPQQEEALVSYVNTGDSKLIPDFKKQSNKYLGSASDGRQTFALMQDPNGKIIKQPLFDNQQKATDAYGEPVIQGGSMWQQNLNTNQWERVGAYEGGDMVDAKAKRLSGIKWDSTKTDNYNSAVGMQNAMYELHKIKGYTENAGELGNYLERTLSPQFLKSQEGKKFTQAYSTSYNSVLRAFAGAAQSEGEAQRIMDEYGIQMGDDPGIINQKLKGLIGVALRKNPEFIEGYTSEARGVINQIIQEAEVVYPNSDGTFMVYIKKDGKIIPKRMNFDTIQAALEGQ